MSARALLPLPQMPASTQIVPSDCTEQTFLAEGVEPTEVCRSMSVGVPDADRLSLEAWARENRSAFEIDGNKITLWIWRGNQ